MVRLSNHLRPAVGRIRSDKVNRMRNINIIVRLLKSCEPSVQYKTRVNVFGESRNSRSITRFQQDIKNSVRARRLLKNRASNGYVRPVMHAYKKWNGAHWILATLADIGHPHDKNLAPVVDQAMKCWLQPVFTESVILKTPIPCWKDKAVPIINGRARRCGSQHANALYAALTLGFVDERTDKLAELLMKWQWPDGGWPVEAKFYQSRDPNLSGYDLVDWGRIDRKASNEWITVDALYVLNASGRI